MLAYYSADGVPNKSKHPDVAPLCCCQLCRGNARLCHIGQGIPADKLPNFQSLFESVWMSTVTRYNIRLVEKTYLSFLGITVVWLTPTQGTMWLKQHECTAEAIQQNVAFNESVNHFRELHTARGKTPMTQVMIVLHNATSTYATEHRHKVMYAISEATREPSPWTYENRYAPHVRRLVHITCNTPRYEGNTRWGETHYGRFLK